ncbi:laminin EGF domain-containing protein [Ditylenchus destructor]|nr:laminin EGF domain-containing protein [Ditylenchus destructor]
MKSLLFRLYFFGFLLSALWTVQANVIDFRVGTDVELSQSEDNYQEFSAGKGEKGLFPNIFNLATHAEIRATSTCGQHGPEYYCKLVEHVFLRQPQCDICDANNHLKNHPIDYAIDGTRRCWQSPSLGTWVLEKSLDGKNFTPWQFYANTNADCMRVFGMPATEGVPKFSRDDEVHCTSYYSQLNPLEEGEIHTSLVNGRPGADHSSPELQNFTRTRFVRLRLLALRTLHADLMVINRRDGRLDQSVTRRYFYSISDISIGGQCICYGHAERCPPDEIFGQFRCECRHNTCGESCNQCCPLYNQLPWKPGTHHHPNVCQACQCFNHAIECVYDEEVERQRISVTPEGIYEGGGKCLDCQHNTGGINCEKCLDGFYRPTNVSHYRHDACRPCDCDLVGAENNDCIRDETEASNELRPGDCICKPGFGGRRCDRCALGFRNHPVCEPCPCHQAGSLNFDTCEEEHCSCKQNVEGEFCDRCKPGTIYLDKDNPLGCQSCFCFGKTTECRDNEWQTAWISSHNGWTLTDLYGQLSVSPPNTSTTKELLIFNSDDYPSEPGQHSAAHTIYYWKLPKELLHGGGKQRVSWLNSFGANLHYYVYFVPREGTQGQPTPVADLIIEGNDLRLEYYSRLNFFPRENISVTVPFRVVDNWYDGRTRRPVGKTDLMRVLADVKNVYVRSKYHQDQLQSSIYGLRLETAIDDSTQWSGNGISMSTNPILGSSKSTVHPVEICTCPEHFEGNSCERCEVGYRRVGNQLFSGICEKCECQGHSEECDPHTGHCINCQHNTTGSRCEQCLVGYYGNPSLGGELGACRRCACPTVENSHSAHCTLSQLGYDGNKCEICADGYFGDPWDPVNGTCQPCTCSGNIDPAAIGNCDRKTGQCLRCIGHTTGDQCEMCEDNHWGSALIHTCRPCLCHHIGSERLQCDNETGTCQCKENYTGHRCDRCVTGHGDVDNGCPSCDCDLVGSIGTTCDEESGQCQCKPGVYGKLCDKCVPSYFNFTEQGCQFCHCNEFGAIPGKECNNITGECQCQPNVEGLRCEKCIPGFFNITSKEGCEACECDQVGSLVDDCHPGSGQCKCKPGVTGLKCDKCAPNHYGLDIDGCKQCQVCPAPGQVCDPTTGECVCPPNTVGKMCEKCTANAWNYHPYSGCQLCDCNGIGADGQECDSRTGQCKCKPGYIGHQCDHCEAGHYNFPDCEPCNCNLAGTDSSQCKGSTCLCSNEGQCKCKKHVTGLKCDECAENSFSLEVQNPNGCTECFCFNRSTTCTQSSLVWHQIYSPDRQVRFEHPFEIYARRHNIHILHEQPLNYNSYPTNHTPLYWPLPRTFLGDRTASYNGYIRFRIRNDDNYRGRPNVRPEPSTFRLFPQVVLVGNHRIELELHESLWQNRISPQLPVSRKQFMVALQNLQAIYIRATYNPTYRGDTISISELSLDVASELSSTDSETASQATGVELCADCDVGYTGPSCQNPTAGFYRKKDLDYLNNPDDIFLIGVSTRCACNEHSKSCDSETGRCNDCEHNTIGDFCEFCRPGYYGNAFEGHADACHKCACPLLENSFSDTCRSTTADAGGYVCDACKPGYTGQYCERCVAGYYGNPTVSGGYCALCGCHPYGSLYPVCQNTTGQCQCREGVEGRDCSSCRPRHAFINGICTSCDHGCYKELMMIEDDMERALASVQNFTDTKPIPRKRLNRIANTVTSLNEILDNIKSSESEAEGLLLNIGTENRYLKQANVAEQEFNLQEERNNDSLARLDFFGRELDAVRDVVHEQNRRVVDISNQLAQFSQRAGGVTDQPGELEHLVLQAEQYLESIRERDQNIEKELNYARNHAEKSERLLKDILSKKLDDTVYKDVVSKHTEYRDLIRDYRKTIWDQAKTSTITAKAIAHTTNDRLKVLERTIEQISELNRNATKELDEAQEFIEKTKNSADDIHSMYEEVEGSLVPSLKETHQSLTERDDESHQAISRDELSNQVAKANRHAAGLEHEARHLKGFFTATQAFSSGALSASNAYSEILVALNNATNAASVAKSNAVEAFGVVDPSSESSLVTVAVTSLKRSNELSQELDKTLNELSITETTSQLQKSLDKVKEIEAEIDRNITWIKDVQQLLDDHHDRINTIHSTVDDAYSGLEDIQQRAEEFTQAVDEAKTRADSILGYDQQSILEDIANVTQSTAGIAEMEKALESVRSRTDSHDSQIKAIKKDLGVLKEKINEAREKASKIRIGVKSDIGSNCVREYISPMNPAPSNVIALKYRPAIDSPDSLIFLSTTQGTRTQGREYIAVELKGKKIHVLWDVGDGKREAAIIKRNILYIPSSDRYTWYHIEIKRVANTIQVSVVQKQALTGEGAKNIDEPTQVTVGEPDPTNQLIFNTVPGQTRIYVGHVDSQLTGELGLTTNRFYGTLGEINIDGENLPLWVFDSSYGNCDGSAGLPTQVATGHMFRDGFAQIRLPISERANTMITVLFSAYSPNGLLYFRGSQTTGAFIALGLDEGAVSLKAHFGEEGPTIAIKSEQSSYADGKAHRVRVIRKDGEVHLQVDQDADTVSTALADEAVMLNIPEPEHYVGGVPPNLDQSKFASYGIPFSGFFGCIQSVKPNQLSELDLDHPVRSQRVQPGCAYKEERLTTSDRVIGFSRPGGYVVSKNGVQLTTDSSSLSFNLRTRSNNAVLLYQSAKLGQSEGMRKKREESDNTFIGFYLFNGRLIAHLGTDSQQRLKRPSLSSNHSYNDGLLHSVFLSRVGPSIQVRIDDREVLSATLEDDRPIGSENAAIVFGGLPEWLRNKEHDLGTSESLIGCLSDFQYNYQRLPIVLEQHQATMGSCEFDRKGMLETDSGIVDSNEPSEEERTSNFHRKKSKQSLEAVAPTLSTWPIVSGADHEESEDISKDTNRYLVSSAGRSRRREMTCGTSFLQTAGNISVADIGAKDVGYRFGVSDSSHARINFAKPYPDYNDFTLSFSMRTAQKKSMVWVWASYKNYTRYFFLNMEKGFLTLEIKGHKQPKVLQYKAKRLNDNQWHKVDDLPPEYLKDAPNPKVMRKRMYVGGVISKHRKQFNLSLPGFSGCIRDFTVNSVEHSLLATSRDVIPCAYSRSVAYIHDGGFATFDPLKTHGKLSTKQDVEFSLQFRSFRQEQTGAPNDDNREKGGSSLVLGLMSTSEDSYQTARLTIRIENSTLVLTAYFTKFRINLEHKFAPSTSSNTDEQTPEKSAHLPPICAGEWHRLSIRLGHQSSTIILDHDKLELKTIKFPSALLEEMRSMPVHVGGTTAPVSVGLGTRSLLGCFKSLELSGVPVALESAKKIHKIVKDGCPY